MGSSAEARFTHTAPAAEGQEERFWGCDRRSEHPYKTISVWNLPSTTVSNIKNKTQTNKHKNLTSFSTVWTLYHKKHLWEISSKLWSLHKEKMNQNACLEEILLSICRYPKILHTLFQFKIELDLIAWKLSILILMLLRVISKQGFILFH